MTSDEDRVETDAPGRARRRDDTPAARPPGRPSWRGRMRWPHHRDSVWSLAAVVFVVVFVGVGLLLAGLHLEPHAVNTPDFPHVGAALLGAGVGIVAAGGLLAVLLRHLRRVDPTTRHPCDTPGTDTRRDGSTSPAHTERRREKP
ncbi:hypothetical protein [Frankia sp. Cas3]|uniref:hypothetical protein n=1 Tax=Frankia sp. Cas3 TaxID=3073926 RepID=UPI002AD59420|nr:hypothetical protein [Frankia sp. Cas3]